MPVGMKTKSVLGFFLVMLFCVTLLEILCHFLPKSFYEFDYRYLYFSRNALRNVNNTYWTYAPDARVRTVTIYKYPGASAILEGDVTLETNHLGLVQRTNLEKNKKTIALLGDSFTEGQLCDPWFYSLDEDFQKNNPGAQLVNMGLMGTGPQHWELLLKDVKKDYDIGKVLIIFIQNDFERGIFSWDQHQMECIDKGICTDDYWYGIDPSASQEDILAATETRSRSRHGRSVKKSLDGFLRRWLYSYRYIRATMKSITDADMYMTKSSCDEATDKNLAAIRRIISEVGTRNAVFLSVSSRPEAERHAFEEKTKHLVQELASFTSPGHIHSLLLKPDDFTEYDGHPNAQGYAKIKNTVADILADMADMPAMADMPDAPRVP